MNCLKDGAVWHVDLLLANDLQQWGVPPAPTPPPGVTICHLLRVCLPAFNCRLITLDFSRFLTLVTALHESLWHTDQCSQSWSSPHCWVTSSNSLHSSTPGLMPSQAGSYLTRLEAAMQWLTCHIMYHITWYHIPEDNNHYGHFCENHKYHLAVWFVKVGFPPQIGPFLIFSSTYCVVNIINSWDLWINLIQCTELKNENNIILKTKQRIHWTVISGQIIWSIKSDLIFIPIRNMSLWNLMTLVCCCFSHRHHHHPHCQHHCWLLLLLFQFNWAFSIIWFKI
jgi:hypothetical protein